MKAGDRVVVKKDHWERFIRNKTGTFAIGREGVGIIFDKPVAGCHNLDGACADGYGWYVLEEDLELAKEVVTGVLQVGDI